MKKNILVTGGAGFIGSHLCVRLLQEGNHVICLDNFFTGSKDNILDLLSNKDFQVIEQDINIPFELNVDEIYNLASPASPVYYQKDPVQTTKTAVLGALNVLELAKKSGAKVLQASTSEVYGDPEVHPQPESYWGRVNPIGLRSCYDEGKRCAEALFFDYYRQYGVKIKVMRIFNTYGPNMQINDGRVVSNFIVQALKGNELEIYGDGSQTRSFCFVDDLVEAMCQMMDSRDEIVGPINVGNETEITIKELAEKVISITNSKSKIVYKPLPEDDPKIRKPDITKIKELFDWTAKVELLDGLKQTVDYFKQIVKL